MRPPELEALIAGADDVAVLDVRSGAEFRRGHVPGARHFPFWRALVAEVPRASRVVVYCGHGPRAWLAAAQLRLRGVAHVCLLAGHMAGWRRDGRPVAR